VTWADAIHGHEEALKDGGRPGLLNEHGVLSALARPYDGYHRRIHEKAAALLHGVVCNHGFIDANKRTALYLVELLVQRSGYDFVETDAEVVETILAVARGEMGYDELTDWFSGRIVRVDPR